MSVDRYQQHVFEMEAASLYLRPQDFLAFDAVPDTDKPR
jgi:hypothetical protein